MKKKDDVKNILKAPPIDVFSLKETYFRGCSFFKAGVISLIYHSQSVFQGYFECA